MTKNKFLEKKKMISAVAGILVLLLAGSCVAQSPPEMAGSDGCNSCHNSISVEQTANGESGLLSSEDEVQEMKSLSAPLKVRPGNCSPLSPVGLISNPSPIFNWTAAYNATKYNLEVYYNNSIAANDSLDAGDYLVAKESFDAEDVTHGNLCSKSLSVYLPDGIYYWKVQACNDDVCGYWSRWEYFENICASKPEKVAEKMAASDNGMNPEKDAIEDKIEMIRAEREIIEAKVQAAQEKRASLNGDEGSGCNCRSEN